VKQWQFKAGAEGDIGPQFCCRPPVSLPHKILYGGGKLCNFYSVERYIVVVVCFALYYIHIE